jgi:hypothetical protein
VTASPRAQPDRVVGWLAYCLSEAQAAVSWIAYSRLARRWSAKGWSEPYFNYAYAALWAVLFIALIAAAIARPDYSTLFALIASYRYLGGRLVPQAAVRFYASAHAFPGAEPALPHDRLGSVKRSSP